jgi:osmoprotectant transport system ATP-binding protein
VNVIELDHVRKSYGSVVALAETSFTLAEGARLALLGGSGSGKSTLLHMVMGLVAPDAGTVRVLGAQMTAEAALSLRHRIGYVIQEGGLFPHLTARRNVAIMSEHLGWEREREDDRVEVLRKLVGLTTDVLGRYPGELSGGQRQRVGLMRALLLDPPLLLLDEPLGALDAVVRKRLQRELREIIVGLGKTVLLVTHDASEAAALADEIAVMAEGKLVQRGTMSELLESPKTPFVKELLG